MKPKPPLRRSVVVKHSLVVAGHPTSISLEQAFWRALQAIAAARRKPVAALVAEIDGTRDPGANLSSACRVFVLEQVLQSRSGTEPADGGHAERAAAVIY